MTQAKINLEWYDAQRTMIVFTFHNGWTVEEFKTIYHQALEMTSTVTHLVGYICDLTRTTGFPPHIFEAAYFTNQHLLPNLYMTVLVNPPQIARVIIGVLRRLKLIIIDHVALADSIESAAAILQAQAQTERDKRQGRT